MNAATTLKLGVGSSQPFSTLRIAPSSEAAIHSVRSPWAAAGVSVQEAAQWLGVGRETIYRMIRSQRLAGVKFDHAWRIHIPMSCVSPCVA